MLRFAAEIEGRCLRCLTDLPEGKTTYCSKQCKKACVRQRHGQRVAMGGKRPAVRCPHPGKRSFENRRAAEVRLRQISPRGGAKLEAYECRCGSWHLGHRWGGK